MVKLKKNKERIPKKFYIKLLILVFFLILAIGFAIINSGSGYEKDYIDEYKVEKPVEEKGTITSSTEEFGAELYDIFTPLMIWTVIITITLVIVGQIINITRRSGLV